MNNLEISNSLDN